MTDVEAGHDRRRSRARSDGVTGPSVADHAGPGAPTIVPDLDEGAASATPRRGSGGTDDFGALTRRVVRSGEDVLAARQGRFMPALAHLEHPDLPSSRRFFVARRSRTVA